MLFIEFFQKIYQKHFKKNEENINKKKVIFVYMYVFNMKSVKFIICVYIFFLNITLILF